MNKDERETKQVEYTAAQEMLRHYDSLNWQIGSIFIAATIVLTGLAINKDFLDLLKSDSGLTWLIAFAVPAFSFFILLMWQLWFRRHRELYNLRNETLHRLETELHMYHFLRVLEASGVKDLDMNRLKLAEAAASEETFEPFVKKGNLPRPSGYELAWALTIGIPVLQLFLFIALKLMISAANSGKIAAD